MGLHSCSGSRMVCAGGPRVQEAAEAEKDPSHVLTCTTSDGSSQACLQLPRVARPHLGRELGRELREQRVHEGRGDGEGPERRADLHHVRRQVPRRISGRKHPGHTTLGIARF